MKYSFLFYVCLFCLLIGCSPNRNSTNYSWQNIKKRQYNIQSASLKEGDFYLLILVDARHLDYSSTLELLKTMSKHPSNGSKNGDFGHAWIELHGIQNGNPQVIEGGHSGERGIIQEKYFDGIMNYRDFGYANPTNEQKKYPRYEPNPIKYLWEPLYDGFFEKGSGGHTPTFGIKIDISPCQYNEIIHFIHTYDFSIYSLAQSQCSSFVVKIAQIAGLSLDSLIKLPLAQKLYIEGEWIRLWEDPAYSCIFIHSPDILEASMIRCVEEGYVDYGLTFYKKKHSLPWKENIQRIKENIFLFPARMEKWFFIHQCKESSPSSFL